jgi:hypothetical protein
MMHTSIEKRLAIGLCLFAAVLNTAHASAAEADLPAIWRVQQLELSFHAQRTLYSCDGLKQKIAAVLAAIGAGPGSTVRLPCQPDVLTNRAVVALTVAMPVEATPENIEAATNYSAEMQLLARLKNIPLPTANDLKRFPARRQSVELHKLHALDGGDCDLLRALATQVFPQLGVQAENRLKCSLMSNTRMRPRFVVTALLPVSADSVTYAGRARPPKN